MEIVNQINQTGFIKFVKKNIPTYCFDCKYYVNNDDVWYACSKDILHQKRDGNLLKGTKPPNDEFGASGDIYIQMIGLVVNLTSCKKDDKSNIFVYGSDNSGFVIPENRKPKDELDHTYNRGKFLLETYCVENKNIVYLCRIGGGLNMIVINFDSLAVEYSIGYPGFKGILQKIPEGAISIE